VIEETPRHLRIETYFLDEIQHLKNHVLGMILLADPEWHSQRLEEMEDWERLTRSFEGQFQILFGSLERIKPQIGEEMHERLYTMGAEAKRMLEDGRYRDGAFLLRDMDDLGWSKRAQNRILKEEKTS
jgi:hypothetical protein